MAGFGVPGQNINTLAYADGRATVVPMYQGPRRPTVTDKKYPLWSEWRTNKDSVSPVSEGEFWKLVRFESNGDATWQRVDFGGAAPGVDFLLTDDGPTAVGPDGSGIITITGGTGLTTSGQEPSTTVTINLDTSVVTTQYDADTGSATPTAGVMNVVGGAGIATSAAGNTITVALVGGSVAADQFDVDFNTAPGVDPVNPTALGLVSIYGNTVPNGTNASAPVATHSRALNQFHIDVQLGTAVAATPADPDDAGLVSVDNVFFDATANGFVSFKDETVLNMRPGDTINLGMAYSSPTYSITAADGSALSATNPGWVCCPSATEGEQIVFRIESNVTWEDSSGTSDIVGNTFGITSGDDWGSNDIPFFIYVCCNNAEDEVSFFVNRSPGRQTMDAAGAIGFPGTANCLTQGGFWSMTTITAANYASNTVGICGCFRMRTSQPGDDWTVRSMGTQDGFGKFFQPFAFNFPTGLFGAASGTYIQDNSGTAPVFTTNRYKYTFIDFNSVRVDILLTGDGGTDGSGAVDARMVIPFKVTAEHIINAGCFRVYNPTFDHGCITSEQTNQSYVMFDDLTDGSRVQNGDFTNGDRRISGQFDLFLAQS